MTLEEERKNPESFHCINMIKEQPFTKLKMEILDAFFFFLAFSFYTFPGQLGPLGVHKYIQNYSGGDSVEH